MNASFSFPGSAAGAAALKQLYHILHQPKQSGQGPPGRGIAEGVSLLSVGERGRRPLPPTTSYRQKNPRFTVFCAHRIFSPFSDLVAQDGSTWANTGLKMGQHRSQDGPT